jgi:Protein of unknown function (DUF2924)
MTSPDKLARMNQEIERLKALDLRGVRLQWRNRFGRMAPKALPRSLLVRVLIYRVQADLLGDLESDVVRVLDRFAARDRGVNRRGRPSARSLGDGPGIKPGSVLVREWAGQLHRVMAVDEGFAWEGKTYRSLSTVARAITGTQWNGRRFFGLNRQKEKPEGSADKKARRSAEVAEEARP